LARRGSSGEPVKIGRKPSEDLSTIQSGKLVRNRES
jgi:hypothetical protein